MNSDLQRLHPYPFEKLNALKAAVTAPAELAHIALSIGEPKHPAPSFVTETLANNLQLLSNYPSTKGLPELRSAIANWASQRFQLAPGSLNPEQHVLPVSGTREALFAFTQAVIDRRDDALIVTPNPFYQIYEGAALLAGAEPHYLPCLDQHGFIPDFDQVDAATWQRCQLLFLCSPGNPTGAVIDTSVLKKLIALADQYDFVIASDECYSELYFDEQQPPAGLLQACAELGRNDFKRCAVFHSLSKRSNLPGLRSGFVAGDADIMQAFLLYRTYHGCALPIQHQLASIAAWQDEAHVKQNRKLYRQKFTAVLDILGDCLEVAKPDAGFYLWAKTPICDKDFAQQLFAQQNVTVLPGQFLGREVNGSNPGQQRVRMALVASLDECIEAAHRIKHFVNSLK
ncbi:succinyldiaminopimelate transaminase [Dasania sp. GY-MA-18]|uniref:Succinyldiaminopimelate transaminase n=1 Tax=Dasania phycosphaerae TaxID=2950436 RepID=A0A9J6RQJ1_9GAMM|nr:MULTISPECIES: succinyldiaminopimelate transaminase [Dasania]MCR8923965.1 succinyldiaminopimelate transaminase [Dasania sp. GY-MA-18]MCZ0866399.1 succinyldiaminopimelate transaminase [Dasania phycosphaerae]MCZ0870123.1 succinyldiaminopimelate transaminase [Dasania phycosphaerae]